VVDINSDDTASAIEAALIEFTAGDTGSGTDADASNPTSFDTAIAVDEGVRAAVSESLAFWLPSVNAPVPNGYFEWGSVPRGSSGDKQFRVKNTSLASKAIGVTVSLTGSGSGSSNPANLHLLSKDSVRFTASVELGIIVPGGMSDIITLRRVLPNALSTGAKTCSLVISNTDWEVEFWPALVLSSVKLSSDTGAGVDDGSVEVL